MKTTLAVTLTAVAIIALVLFCSLVGLIPQAVQLGFMPWQTHQETMIYRNSLGASAANIAQLRNLYTAYVGTTSTAEQTAIAAQMHSAADNMNTDDLPPDLRAFLASH